MVDSKCIWWIEFNEYLDPNRQNFADILLWGSFCSNRIHFSPFPNLFLSELSSPFNMINHRQQHRVVAGNRWSTVFMIFSPNNPIIVSDIVERPVLFKSNTFSVQILFSLELRPPSCTTNYYRQRHRLAVANRWWIDFSRFSEISSNYRKRRRQVDHYIWSEIISCLFRVYFRFY